MDSEIRIQDPLLHDEDRVDQALRPLQFSDFVGQKPLVENLKVFIAAAKMRGDAMDHVLLHGPPGLGKTTLAQIIAHELGVNFRATSAPILMKSGDLAAILTNLQQNDVLFIDEIHRMPATVEEMLYSAMEDFKLDIMIGEGPAARSIRLDLPRFTIIGATTRSGMLTQPLRERFGIPLRLDYYTHDELTFIIQRAARLLNLVIAPDAAAEIARRSRGTPRVAGRLLRRVRDFSAVGQAPMTTQDLAIEALNKLDVDQAGLDTMDRRYLTTLATYYKGGPAGLDTLAAALSEARDTIEDVIEPYLIQQGFIQKTPRGRELAAQAYTYLGIDKI